MRKKLKILFILILLLVLVAGGFALGVYLRLFDTQALNEEYGLHELPIIGEYFVPPAGEETETTHTAAGDVSAQHGTHAAQAAAPKKASESVKITKEEIEKQQKERETAEKKRVTKLARLYNDMKAADAAKVMESLDIDLCIAILQRMDEGNAAKVMAAFEPERAAQITQIIYEGVSKKSADARSTAAKAPVPGTEQEKPQQQ